MSIVFKKEVCILPDTQSLLTHEFGHVPNNAIRETGIRYWIPLELIDRGAYYLDLVRICTGLTVQAI